MVIPSTGIYFNYMYGTTTRLQYGSSATVHKIDAKYIPSTSWGGITGTLSNQTDLQSALDAKVSDTRTVNGHPLSSNVTVTAADTGALPLSGGTMTGGITFSDANGICGTQAGANRRYLWNNNGIATLGSGYLPVRLDTNSSDVIHKRSGTDYIMYDENNLVPNVSNPTTSLTSL